MVHFLADPTSSNPMKCSETSNFKTNIEFAFKKQIIEITVIIIQQIFSLARDWSKRVT